MRDGIGQRLCRSPESISTQIALSVRRDLLRHPGPELESFNMIGIKHMEQMKNIIVIIDWVLSIVDYLLLDMSSYADMLCGAQKEKITERQIPEAIELYGAQVISQRACPRAPTCISSRARHDRPGHSSGGSSIMSSAS